MLLRAAACAVLLASCSGEPDRTGIEIGNAWARATPPGATIAAGYLTLMNRGPQADRLIGAESTAAQRIELHGTRMDERGMVQMRPFETGIELPVNEAVHLEPGAAHLMLIGLRQPFVEGARIPVTLRFEKAPARAIELAVQPLGASDG